MGLNVFSEKSLLDAQPASASSGIVLGEQNSPPTPPPPPPAPPAPLPPLPAASPKHDDEQSSSSLSPEAPKHYKRIRTESPTPRSDKKAKKSHKSLKLHEIHEISKASHRTDSPMSQSTSRCSDVSNLPTPMTEKFPLAGRKISIPHNENDSRYEKHTVRNGTAN